MFEIWIVYNRQSNKQVFFSLEFVNILTSDGGLACKKCVFTSLIQRSDVARLLQDFNSFSFPRDRTEEMVL